MHTAQSVLYLSAIRDLFDNSIVAYKTGTEQTINLVLNTVRAATEIEAVTTELQLHSDPIPEDTGEPRARFRVAKIMKGLQYTSRGYFNLLQEYGIVASMSRRGSCYDNTMAENFFGILKA